MEPIDESSLERLIRSVAPKPRPEFREGAIRDMVRLFRRRTSRWPRLGEWALAYAAGLILVLGLAIAQDRAGFLPPPSQIREIALVEKTFHVTDCEASRVTGVCGDTRLTLVGPAWAVRVAIHRRP